MGVGGVGAGFAELAEVNAKGLARSFFQPEQNVSPSSFYTGIGIFLGPP